MTPALFDAHCHATQKMPAPESAPMASAPRRLVCGVAPADWNVIADWAHNWPGTIPAFGIHPWEAEKAERIHTDWEAELEALLLRFPAAWVGEIGLDGLKTDRAPMPQQADTLARQLRIAARLQRPVNLHCVKAETELLAILDKEYFTSGLRTDLKKCILHSFAGSPETAKAFAARGAYFSVGPLASRRDTRKIRARTAALPPDRLLLESDAYLAPGADAEEDLDFTLRRLSDVLKTPPENVAAALADNAQRMLNAEH